jgi:type IV secretory pathway VirB6-like protein
MGINWKKFASVGFNIAALLFPVVGRVEAISDMFKDKGTPWSSQQKEDEAVRQFFALLQITEAGLAQDLLNDSAFQTLVRNTIKNVVAIQNTIAAAKNIRVADATSVDPEVDDLPGTIDELTGAFQPV